jgi:nucleotide-binding universal stress UspA family protein
VYQNIMLTLDGSALADEAIDRAMDIATTSGGHVVLLDVVPEHGAPFPFSIEAWREVERREAQEHLTSVKRRLAARVAAVDVLVVEGDSPGRTIVDVAHRLGCDAVVMATHGRTGLGRLLHGSVSAYVSRHLQDADVLLVQPQQKVAVH